MAYSTVKQIVVLRKRFAELLPGSSIGNIYKQMSDEFYEDAHTIALKVNCAGYYRKFLPEVKKNEKKNWVKS